MLGLEDAKILTLNSEKLTAQQTWPFVAAAYSTNGTPCPCWFIIRSCDEMDQLIAYMKRAEKCGNGYFKRRVPSLLSSLEASKNNSPVSFSSAKDPIFKEINPYKKQCENIRGENMNPFTADFLHKFPLSEKSKALIHEFVSGNKNAGDTLASVVELESLTDNDRKAALALLLLCYDAQNKNGLFTVLRSDQMKTYSRLSENYRRCGRKAEDMV